MMTDLAAYAVQSVVKSKWHIYIKAGIGWDDSPDIMEGVYRRCV
nr:hypothetical protein [uncultured Prevotella sp.]